MESFLQEETELQTRVFYLRRLLGSSSLLHCWEMHLLLLHPEIATLYAFSFIPRLAFWVRKFLFLRWNLAAVVWVVSFRDHCPQAVWLRLCHPGLSVQASPQQRLHAVLRHPHAALLPPHWGSQAYCLAPWQPSHLSLQLHCSLLFALHRHLLKTWKTAQHIRCSSQLTGLPSLVPCGVSLAFMEMRQSFHNTEWLSQASTSHCI